ncbi:hypothetical protein [Sorangium sp. So ce131]|uniref:hypothetical protein n=1 Tax=Sorangium sp. So ce131 TaxID=3133282 RepID=UPI003F5D66BB
MGCCNEAPTPTRPAPAPPPPVVQACPLNCTYTAVWVDTRAYCGDNARMEAVITPAPPDGPATVEVLLANPGGTPSSVSTINTRVAGGRVDATWVAKAASASWRTDQMQFRIHVPGATVTGISSNTFAFRQRPTTDWILINTDRPVPASCGSTPRKVIYDARLEASTVHQSLKLLSHGDASVTDAIKSSFEALVKTQAETIWNNGFTSKKFHRRSCQRGASCDCTFDCCKIGFRFDLNFAAGQHWRVKIIPDPNPASPSITSWTLYDTSEWAYPPKAPSTTYAHEAGHMIGQYDEYVTSCNDPAPAGTQYRQPAPVPSGEENLMSHSGNTILLNRHYRWMLRFLNDNAGGDLYEIIPPGP